MGPLSDVTDRFSDYTARMKPATSTIQEKVAQLYYSHGLFCSNYPLVIITCAISIAVLCCYPLVNLPLPGSAPSQRWTSSGKNGTLVGHQPPPFCYIQQVILRTVVLPWQDDLTLADAFRAPLYEAFKLLEIVRNYQDEHSSKTLGHVCLHIEATKRLQDVLPQYSCLVLSPANLWQQDVQQFSKDSSLLTTIFNHHSFQQGKTSVAEMLFGMRLFDTGIKRYPLRNRQRSIQYAITLFLKKYDENFTYGLRQRLNTLYPLHQDNNLSAAKKHHHQQQQQQLPPRNDTLLIHYPSEINYWAYVSPTFGICLLFIYYYFSVRKIEMIHCKVGMAFTAVATVLGSFVMTNGLCFFFGLTLTLEGKAIYPYLVILVGLENVLVLTKSVVTTQPHLDVKIRMAQGLSREGWSITKNLLLEITILTIGLFTFVPTIQELCIFSIVGLWTDFFWQMLVFFTVLAVDIRRMEGESTTAALYATSNNNSLGFMGKSSQLDSTVMHHVVHHKNGMNRSKSHPKLSMICGGDSGGNGHTKQQQKRRRLPKRLRLVNMWARTRFFQRIFMLLMCVWISNIVYSSGFIERYIVAPANQHAAAGRGTSNQSQGATNYSTIKLLLNHHQQSNRINFVTSTTAATEGHTGNSAADNVDDLELLKHPKLVPWLKLSPQHWLYILDMYNLSASGQFVAVLPTIRIANVIPAQQAIRMRHPDEKYGDKFQWQALAAALDPIDFSKIESGDIGGYFDEITLDVDAPEMSLLPMPLLPHSHQHQPFYPTSIFALILTTILCTISIAVLAYIFVVLYRCICSRNYAEWRASWFSGGGVGATMGPASSGVTASQEDGNSSGAEEATRLPPVPLVLCGHHQQVECMSADGARLVSTCLDGQINVWDTTNGEALLNINRNLHFQESPSKYTNSTANEEQNSSDYESDSPPPSTQHTSNTFLFPRLKRRINTDFSNLTDYDQNGFYHADGTYDSTSSFTKTYRELYFDKDVLKVRRNNHQDRQRQRPKQLQQQKCDQNSAIFANNNRPFIGKLSTIWCMDFAGNLIVIGCANGRLEFWDSTTGQLKCTFEDGIEVGVTHVKIVASKVIASRLYGTLDLFQLQTYTNGGRAVDWSFTCAYQRTHIRTGSFGSTVVTFSPQTDNNSSSTRTVDNDELSCVKMLSLKSHQQPITCLDCEGGRILTGSQDHTLKVIRLEDGLALYTLHGHCGPITCLFIDRVNPATSGSGSQDGSLFVWDLPTGTCMYSIQAHDGSVVSLTYSASYVISLGTDERLCVWERFQGHLLQTIYVQYTACITCPILMLTPHLVVVARTAGADLAIWDVRTAECVRTIVLGRAPYVFVKHLILWRDSILCDYGTQLRIVRFPMITHSHKFD